MKKKITKKEIHAAKCSCPGCQEDDSVLYLHSQCHPLIPVWVAYDKVAECLVISCAECKRVIANIAVSFPAIEESDTKANN